MNLFSRASLGLGGLLLSCGLSGSSSHTAAPSPIIQQRIDALLKHRLKPEPLPTDPPNPFQVTSGSSTRDLAADGVAVKPATRGANEVNTNLPAAVATSES